MESTVEDQGTVTKSVETLERVVIRFAGDSGDGIQLTGNQFTKTTAAAGNDLATFPDFPAEIRAPAGTLGGVSGFQIQFSSGDVFTPGDSPNVLVAMNPAALKVNLADLTPNGILIVNTDSFGKRDLQKADYGKNPLEDGSLSGYRTFRVSLTDLTLAALSDNPLPKKSKTRCKNFFALGMVYWLYSRPLKPTQDFIRTKFGDKADVLEANLTALKAGYAYCDANNTFQVHYEVPSATLTPGTYRNIDGNTAAAYGLIAAAQTLELPLFYGTYPITPASEILHELSKHKEFGVITFQAEDEIAGVCSAIGAAYGGSLAATGSSGPGIALKLEAIGLAVMTELPLVIIDVQRAGPSTGMPTKTEQGDLLQVLFGRNSDSPCVVLAAQSPSDCFTTAYEAALIATKHMVPVFVLSDGYLAFGSEPWRLPDLETLPGKPVKFHTDPATFAPYSHDPETLARPWAKAGTPGLEHRIGGLEKQEGSGKISYNPENHQKMVELRQAKVDRVALDLPPIEVFGPKNGKLLCVSWGSTFGAVRAGVGRCLKRGLDVAHIHLRNLSPFPSDLGEILRRYETILVPEMNMGHLRMLLRASFLIDVKGYSKIQGKPFRESEIAEKIEETLEVQS